MVEHPQRVQPRDVGDAALLPVQPPEVHALLLQGVVGVVEVGGGEVLVPDVEGDLVAAGGVQAEPAHHGLVGGLVAADARGGVQVEGDLQAAGVQGGQEALRVGEQVGVPGVAGPAVAERRVDVHQVPVHVDHGHGEGQLLGREPVHESQVGGLGVLVEAAPPVAQQRARDEGRGAGQGEEVAQRPPVVLAVPEQVQVLVRRAPVHGVGAGARADPFVALEQERGGAVDDGDAVGGEQAGVQAGPPVDLVQGAAGAAEVGGVGLLGVPGIAVAPGAAVGADDGGAQAHGQARPGEAPGGLVGQVEVGGEDLDPVLPAAHLEVGRRAQVARDHQLGGGVDEVAGARVLHADEPVGQDGEAGSVRHDDGVGAGRGGAEPGGGGGQR